MTSVLARGGPLPILSSHLAPGTLGQSALVEGHVIVTGAHSWSPFTRVGLVLVLTRLRFHGLLLLLHYYFQAES